jgi:hypothetical protein
MLLIKNMVSNPSFKYWCLYRLVNFAQIFDGMTGLLSLGLYRKSFAFEVLVSIYKKVRNHEC